MENSRLLRWATAQTGSSRHYYYFLPLYIDCCSILNICYRIFASLTRSTKKFVDYGFWFFQIERGSLLQSDYIDFADVWSVDEDEVEE